MRFHVCLMNAVSNIFESTARRQFWVWVDETDLMTHHNMNIVGSFFSTPTNTVSETPMFIHNPNFQGFISPFQSNLMRNYAADYNLELARRARFPNYPCRLKAIFLLDSEEDALTYKNKRPKHVEGRILARGTTNGPYCFSRHNSVCVNFIRLPHMMSPEDIHSCTDACWSGRTAEDSQLMSCGKPWTQERVTEILFIGRLDFDAN